METVLLAIVVYLLIGMISLGILDLATKRIRTRLKDASYDSQRIFNDAGMAFGNKAAFVIIVIALWLYWPAAIIGALGRAVNDKNKK